MVSPRKFRYDGIFSNELNIPDLITCVAFDEDNGDVETRLARETVSSESYDGRYKRAHRFKYTDTFGCTFTLMKSNFSDFTQEEVRATIKWLTQKDTTALLEVYYDDSGVVSWASIGGFVNISLRKLANNRTVAIIAEWDSVHPFCLSDLYTVTKTISSYVDNKITINIDTDDNKPVYPRVTIKHNGSSIIRVPNDKTYTEISTDMIPNTVYFNGETYYWKASGVVSGSDNPHYDWDLVTINNKDYSASDVIKENTVYYYTRQEMYYWIDPYHFHKQDGGSAPALATTSVKFTNTHTDFFNTQTVLPSVIVKNNNSTENVVLDGANKIVSSSSVRRIFGDDFNWKWLELHDGKNEIVIEGNCEVTLEWRTVIKCGEC